MWLRQFNDIINLFLVKQECSSGASFEKSRSIEPYANSSPNRFFPQISSIPHPMKFYLRQLEPFTVSTRALYCHFLSGHFFHNLSLKQTRFENLRQIQRKKLFCDTVFSVISICATDWNYGEAVIKYFTFSFFYTSYWPSSRSVLQVMDRFCGTYWNHGEVVVKYFTFSFFYTYYWSSSRSVLQVTDRFLPCRCMAKGEVRGPY